MQHRTFSRLARGGLAGDLVGLRGSRACFDDLRRVLGPTPTFLQGWPIAWGLSWLIAFPVLLLAMPAARRLTAMLVAPAG